MPVNVPAKFEFRSFTRSWDNRGYLNILGTPWIRRSRSSKVTDFGTNRKRVCNFLLVRHSNLGPVLHSLRDIAGFFCSWVTQPIIHPKFRGVPVAPDRPCWGQPAHKPYMLFCRGIIFEFFRRIPTCVITVPERHWWTDGQTDRQTDRQTTYCWLWHRITALCVQASHGIKKFWICLCCSGGGGPNDFLVGGPEIWS